MAISGMEFMLKQLGIDPKEILGSVEGFKTAFLDIATKLGNIERQNDAVLANQKSLCEKMEVPFVTVQSDQSTKYPDTEHASGSGVRAIAGNGKT